jgi:hypothetical protein
MERSEYRNIVVDLAETDSDQEEGGDEDPAKAEADKKAKEEEERKRKEEEEMNNPKEWDCEICTFVNSMDIDTC